MKILIQKFGGTSVSTEEKRKMVVKKVLKAREDGYSPVLVVSAMGRKGEPYATDTLLSMIDSEFKKENPLSSDLLMSCGEIITTVIVSNQLQNVGLTATPLTGGQAGIITDNQFTNAELVRVDTKNLLNLLSENKIPVIAGFQGKTEDGYVTTLGRGGSDVTASIIGVALEAEAIEIYTDVDGIMTADPRIVKNASLIDEISYNEVFQFADQGAKVIHPRAVEIAMKANIPLIIKNTMTESLGTVISNDETDNHLNIITGITHLSNRTQINVLKDNNNISGFLNLLNVLADAKISIDLITVLPNQKMFTICKEDFDKLNDLLKLNQISYTSIDNCSKIAIIGSRMQGIPGVMAKIINTLNKENIEVLQTADSNATIWCLVNSLDTEKAIIALHKEFKL